MKFTDVHSARPEDAEIHSSVWVPLNDDPNAHDTEPPEVP